MEPIDHATWLHMSKKDRREYCFSLLRSLSVDGTGPDPATWDAHKPAPVPALKSLPHALGYPSRQALYEAAGLTYQHPNRNGIARSTFAAGMKRIEEYLTQAQQTAAPPDPADWDGGLPVQHITTTTQRRYYLTKDRRLTLWITTIERYELK